MGFIQRIFTPPGAGGAPPGSPANPIPTAAAATPAAVAAPPTPAPVAPPPTAPTAPTAPAPPQQFAPGAAPGSAQRAAISGTTFLGAGATTGQTARKTLLGQ